MSHTRVKKLAKHEYKLVGVNLCRLSRRAWSISVVRCKSPFPHCSTRMTQRLGNRLSRHTFAENIPSFLYRSTIHPFLYRQSSDTLLRQHLRGRMPVSPAAVRLDIKIPERWDHDITSCK